METGLVQGHKIKFLGFEPPMLGTLALLPKRGEQEQDVGHTYRAVSVDVRPCAIRCATEVREQEKHI